jgi:LPPG:FO 2-phospho-L-lactate transferase
MMSELGHDASVLGIAALYQEFVSTLIIDSEDSNQKSAIEDLGLQCVVTETVMGKPGVSESLALAVLAGANS